MPNWLQSGLLELKYSLKLDINFGPLFDFGLDEEDDDDDEAIELIVEFEID